MLIDSMGAIAMPHGVRSVELYHPWFGSIVSLGSYFHSSMYSEYYSQYTLAVLSIGISMVAVSRSILHTALLTTLPTSDAGQLALDGGIF